jgi:peptidoglycan/LPS O-acetylase OafA/YrhL
MAAAAGDRSRVVDALRGVAAGVVVAFHVAGLPGAGAPTAGVGQWVMRNLDAGLVLFFVISGYVISRPFVVSLVDGRPRPDLARYALRRACRILPAFWVTLLVVVLAVHGSTHSPGAGPLQAWWQIPLHGLLVQDFVPGQIQQLLKVAWTLDNELLFYVLVPVAALLIARRWPKGISPGRLAGLVLLAWAASAVVALLADQLPPFTDGAAVARYTFPSVAGFFCPGILVAIAGTAAARSAAGPWARLHALWAQPRRWAPLAGGLVVLAILGWRLEVAVDAGGARPLLLDQHWQVHALAFGVLLGGVLATGHRFDRAVRPLAALGLVSYGTYLWHTVVIRFVAAAGLYATTATVGALALPLNVVWVLGLTLLPATASWFLVERPMLRWAASRRPRRAAEPVPVPAVVA